MTGQNLSHYQILDKLGDGGMGEVYKARDTHLDRFVAIKFLRPDRVGDADRRLRFVQEAKAASALNHPNIVTIYDIDIACGVHFIAMEYVPGRTLDRVIGRKGLKLGEALHYAVQMADALAKAHAAGIVHRDVKPSNIMVTDDGVIKVLDFGLAKLTEEVGPDDETATVRTAEGTIVGTAAYMSPEQAEGKTLDARTDIFSFGTVLYEMLTGQRAFEGAARISTLAAILHAQPKAPGTVPGEVGRVLQRCLKKEPQRRFQTMSDLKVALEELKEESDSGTLAAVPGSRPRRRWPLAAAAVAITALAAWLWFPRSVDAPAELRLSKLTFDAGLTADGTISPDGKLAAYASDRGGDGNLDIWVQHIAGRQPIRLTRHEADDQSPAFSPDGSRVVFQSQREGGGLYVVDVLGGEERKIADRGSYPRYSPDGAWISCIVVPAYPGLAKMYLVPAGGGPPKPFLPGHGTAVPPMSYGPVWSPDSRFLLFKGSDGKVADWWVAPVEQGAPVATGAKRSFADLRIWAPNVWWHNYVVLNAGVTTEGVNLFRASFAGKWKLAGPAVPLTSGTGLLYGSPPSRDGRLPVTSLNWLPSHWSLPLKSNQAVASGEPHQLTREGVSKVSAAVSHDGSKLAYLVLVSAGTRARAEVRVRDLASSRETAIPVASTTIGPPVLSADGAVVAYADLSAGKRTFFAAGAGGIVPRRICEDCIVFGFFSDASRACVLNAGRRLVSRDLATGEEVRLGEPGGGRIIDARPSWDDRWLAVLIGKPDGRGVIFAGREQQWIAVAEDSRALACPRWSPDGNLLYYLSARDGHICIWAQRLDPSSKKPFGEPLPVHHLHTTRLSFLGPPGQRSFDVALDKAILLLNETTGNVWTAMLGENDRDK